VRKGTDDQVSLVVSTHRTADSLVQLAPKIITDRFLAMIDELETRLGQDPERARPALIEAIGDRIVMQPDASGRFLWAEYAWPARGC